MNASFIDVFLSIICNNLSFGTTISESTFDFNFSNPFSACNAFFLPSNVNGFVTIAIVNIFLDLAISATTGAAPVPVPPPIPAVMKTIFAPSNTFSISSLLSSAAFSPISALPPAPKSSC